MRTLIIAILMSVMVPIASANQPTPYAGQDTREIKSLSKSEIDGYLSGKGMGLAKAAELNHYPGPRHVLDLSEQLSLTDEQKIRTQRLFNAMKSEATILGNELVNKEKELDQLFATESVTNSKLERRLTEIGAIQSKLRYVHLSIHLEQKNLLSMQQIKRYDQLRGYQASNEHHGGGSSHHSH